MRRKYQLKPYLKEYTNDEKLQDDVKLLVNRGIDKEDIYILSHDDERTNRIASNADANTIGLSEMDFGVAVENLFNKKGDELRNKLQEIGFSELESESLEEDLDEGKILLMITNHDHPETLLDRKSTRLN